ncbi:MAG TPA: hypothetical protein VI953_00230 [Candidatus Paceibacterota bacterium]
MAVDVSLGDFHDTHDRAQVYVDRLKKGPPMNKTELEQALVALGEAQGLTNAETGIDAMYAMQYGEYIDKVRKLLAKTKS